MGLSIPARNSEVDGAGKNQYPAADWYSLHSSDPTDVGSFEASGGLYVRVTPTGGHPAAQNGEFVTPTMRIEMPPNFTATHWGRWTSRTGGTFIRGDQLPEPATSGVQGAAYELAVRYYRSSGTL